MYSWLKFVALAFRIRIHIAEETSDEQYVVVRSIKTPGHLAQERAGRLLGFEQDLFFVEYVVEAEEEEDEEETLEFVRVCRITSFIQIYLILYQ